MNYYTDKKYQEKKSHRDNTRDANLFVPWNKTEYTVCPRSSDPILYNKLQYKMGHYFLDKQYENKCRKSHEFFVCKCFFLIQKFITFFA